MKSLSIVAVLASVALPPLLHAERALIDVYQPTSLLGTDLDADPLGTGESLAATIVTRPVIVGGAFPESPVHAISLPHRIAGAPEGFPDESNLIVIVGAEIHAEWGETEDRIVADFSKARVPDDLGVTLIQVMKMTALCLQKTLGDQHEKPIQITWLAPEEVSLADAGLPSEIERSGEKAGAGQPAGGSEPKPEGEEKKAASEARLQQRGAGLERAR